MITSYNSRYNFLKLARERKTTYEFSAKVPRQRDVIAMLETARWAPSCSNSQPWRFIVVKNRRTVEKLVKQCVYGAFHTVPPVIIACVLEPTCLDMNLVCVLGQKMALSEARMCLAMSALNICYAAHELGVASALLSPRIGEAEKILGIPRGSKVQLLVGVGYEKPAAFRKARTRRALKESLFFERWGRK